MIELSIVVPVYNEEAIIGRVVQEWVLMMESLNINYTMQLYNDGSKDRTGEILEKLKKDYGQRLIISSHRNIGHGPTILKGYKDSLNSEWVFQIDSDNEISPHSFPSFWKLREEYDLIIGNRIGRKSSLIRKTMTAVSSLMVTIFFGSGIKDVNVPFRLMRTSEFNSIFNSVPQDTFAPNILIAGSAIRQKLRVKNITINHNHRTTGSESLGKNWGSLLMLSIKNMKQLVAHSFKQ